MFLKYFSLNMTHSILFAQSGAIAQQSIGLLWTSDQLVAETFTLKQTIFTTEKHLCP